MAKGVSATSVVASTLGGLFGLAKIELCFVVSVGIIIFGWPLTALLDAAQVLNALNLFAFSYLGLMLLSIVGAFAHDVQQCDAEAKSSGLSRG